VWCLGPSFKRNIHVISIALRFLYFFLVYLLLIHPLVVSFTISALHCIFIFSSQQPVALEWRSSVPLSNFRQAVLLLLIDRFCSSLSSSPVPLQHQVSISSLFFPLLSHVLKSTPTERLARTSRPLEFRKSPFVLMSCVSNSTVRYRVSFILSSIVGSA